MTKGTPCAREKIHKVMSEYKHGSLKSGGKTPVTSRRQGVAIALSEARKKCGGGGGAAPKKKK
jgi:hypothetical protein